MMPISRHPTGGTRRHEQHAHRAAKPQAEAPKVRLGDMKLEVVVIPVSDVDRAKRFYGSLGWRLDADFAVR